jgi:hypothetical protein
MTSDIKVVQDPSQSSRLQLAAPYTIHDRRIQGFEQVVNLHWIETKVLQISDVSDCIVAEEHKVAFLAKIDVLHHVAEVLDAVGAMGAERRLEAASNVGGRFSKTDEFGLAKVEAVGTALHEIGVDQVGVVLDAEMASADEGPPLLTISAWGNACQLSCVQRGDSNLSDLVVGALVRLDVDAYVDYVLIEVIGRG